MVRKKAILLAPSPAPRTQKFLDGCRRHEYEVVTLNSRGGHRMDDSLSGVDIAVCSGAKSGTQNARSACARLGIPVVIIDLGYLKRSKGVKDLVGYNQAGWNKLCWVPDGPVDPSRFNALGLGVAESHKPKGPGYILLAGQVGGDAQHGLTEKQILDYLANRAKELRGSWPRGGCVFRPHPSAPLAKLPDIIPSGRVDPARQTLAESLAGAERIVTYNSTLGVDAMLMGIPVDSVSTAHYHKHASGDLETRLAYLHRLAWAQWSLDELERGLALEYLLSVRPEMVTEPKFAIFCKVTGKNGQMVRPRDVGGKPARVCSACGQIRYEADLGPKHETRGEIG